MEDTKVCYRILNEPHHNPANAYFDSFHIPTIKLLMEAVNVAWVNTRIDICATIAGLTWAGLFSL